MKKDNISDISDISLRKLKLYCKMSNLKCSSEKDKDEIIKEIKSNLKKYSFAPRYLRDLNRDEKTLKKFEIRYNTLLERQNKKEGKEKKDYKESISDKLYNKRKSVKKSKKISKSKKRKLSKYTRKWNKIYKTKSMKGKSKVSGVPLPILKKVYNKGLAAWRGSAHRPGARQHEWGVSRVNSFLTCGKTWEFPDHLLAKEAMKKSKKARNFWKKCDKKKLGKKTKSK